MGTPNAKQVFADKSRKKTHFDKGTGKLFTKEPACIMSSIVGGRPQKKSGEGITYFHRRTDACGPGPPNFVYYPGFALKPAKGKFSTRGSVCHTLAGGGGGGLNRILGV